MNHTNLYRPPYSVAFVSTPNHGFYTSRPNVSRGRERAHFSLHQSNFPDIAPFYHELIELLTRATGIPNIYRQIGSFYCVPMDWYRGFATDVHGPNLSRSRLVHWCVCSFHLRQFCYNPKTNRSSDCMQFAIPLASTFSIYSLRS